MYAIVEASETVKGLRRFVPVQTPDKGRTLLHMAAWRGCLEEVVKYHQESGLNLEATNHEGNTPLLLASSCGHLGVARYHVEAGANLEACDFSDNNSVTLAVLSNRWEVVTCLGQAGVNLDLKDREYLAEPGVNLEDMCVLVIGSE